MRTPRPGTFRPLASEVLVDNPWHCYRRDTYTLADGSRGDYFYVDVAGSAGIAPLFEDGTTIVLEVYRYLLGTYLWELPIGGTRRGEEPLEAARRELLEEAGLLATDWRPLGRFAPYKGVSNEVCHFFLARGLTCVGPRPEPSEDITVHRLPLCEARARLLDQELGDGQSLVGLLLLERFLAGGGSGG